ncbi:cyclic nucleotide-binding domain-containing protein [Aurantimonas aggregata]|uniref:Cyclic nucleotide-binding domain-containing protein n=1 Tax=Aurantimonas aggregata TaxID=2047720 RepID=A0A6L9MD03_9HYPH|nr:cation:proton antiporter [Aurantimonas aggregata]NDV85506.1 cyclic nucleotide-binding domain-containing protein [Aurantimonas aggregata]
MFDVAAIILVVASLLLIVAALQPVAARFQLPSTILLAGVGVALGFVAAFLLQTSATDAFNGIVSPIVNLPVRSSIFLYVFLPLLLFQASIMIDVRRVVDDAVPILVLAVLAVVLAAAVIGFSLNVLFGISLVAALLLGSIVATTDPAAVVAIFRELGAPARLTRLVEGESLLNDAAAIALFSLLLTVIVSNQPLEAWDGLMRFGAAFLGGALAGFVGGYALSLALPLIGGIRSAEVTLTLGAVYTIYILSDQFFGVSGVVAVVVAGLAVSAMVPARIAPSNWRYLRDVWEQIGFWAGSLVFLLAAILVPRILSEVRFQDLLIVLTAVAAALAARAVVLFLVLPALSAIGAARPVSLPYSVTIFWGGLRGAVTLALALVVTENAFVEPELKRFVAVTATGFVLFTLFVNGLTLHRVIHWLKLDRLSPVDSAVRNQVLALTLAEVKDTLELTARRYGLNTEASGAVIGTYGSRIEEASTLDIEKVLTDRQRVTLGLIALATREKELILQHHGRGTIAVDAVGAMLSHAERLVEGARSDGRVGYNRAARDSLEYGRGFRIAYVLHFRFSIDRFLTRRLIRRFETLLVLSLLTTELLEYIPQRIAPLLGERIGAILTEIVKSRNEAANNALQALRQQYPEYATAVEEEFLSQLGEQQELSHFDDLFEEGILALEIHQDLRRAVLVRGPLRKRKQLDLKLNTLDMIRSLEIFRHLDEKRVKRLARRLKPRIVLPGGYLARKGDLPAGLYFIASGVVEVRREDQTITLGQGEFFGEIALLTGRPRGADVVALTYCNVLVLAAEDFDRFLKAYPKVREEIEKTALRREEDNAGHRVAAAERASDKAADETRRAKSELVPASD